MLVLEEIELLAVAEMVVLHGLSGGLIDALFLRAESLSGFGGLYLADGVVESADDAVGILLDAYTLVAELDPQSVELLFKFVHFTCFIWRL